MIIEKTEQLVIEWAKERGIFDQSGPFNQFDKLMEEVDELNEAITLQDIEGIIDGIGDSIVVLTNLAHMYGLTLGECYTAAWTEIKDRKGRMIDGKFVKET